MKTFRQKLITYSQFIFRVFAFFTAAFLLYLVLPSEPRFKYEYQKGAPWKHQNLVAPFDFAILKSNQEIEAEKRTLLKTFTPYFITDTTVEVRKLQELKSDLQTLISESYPKKKEVTDEIGQALGDLYVSGILASSPQSGGILNGKTEISKITGKTVTLIPVSLLHSEKSAYRVLNDKVTLIKKRYPGIALQMNMLDLGRYIQSNLKYDEERSLNEIKELESGISTANGLIQEGERIIMQGEIVDDAKFQILENIYLLYPLVRLISLFLLIKK